MQHITVVAHLAYDAAGVPRRHLRVEQARAVEVHRQAARGDLASSRSSGHGAPLAGMWVFSTHTSDSFG